MHEVGEGQAHYLHLVAQLQGRDPWDLAEAGFFYTESGDRVQCAFCTNILCDWEPGDDPMFEHRWHFSGCEFVLSLKATNEPFTSTEQRGEV